MWLDDCGPLVRNTIRSSSYATLRQAGRNINIPDFGFRIPGPTL